MIFHDRKQAGQELAQALLKYKSDKPIIFALLRGGILIAHEVSQLLQCQLEPLVVRKISPADNPEFAIGAACESKDEEEPIEFIDNDLVNQLHLTLEEVRNAEEQEKKEIQKRQKLFRKDHSFPDIEGETVIIVDDGIATGRTALAAIMALKFLNPKKIILAIPVAAKESLDKLRPEIDELICLEKPEPFHAVGEFYKNFEQVTDKQVFELLAK